MSGTAILHATTVARFGPDGWRAAMLTGGSGSGKSDLALRLLASGWRLVADDRTLAWTSGGRLWGRAPEALSGLIEARGLGLMTAPAVAFAPVVLAAALDGPPAERLPDRAFVEVLGVTIPRVRLEATEASASARLELAITDAFAALGDWP